jgi:hypothetical protein
MLGFFAGKADVSEDIAGGLRLKFHGASSRRLGSRFLDPGLGAMTSGGEGSDEYIGRDTLSIAIVAASARANKFAVRVGAGGQLPIGISLRVP